MNTTSPLTAREVYQLLKDVAIGTRVMTRASIQSWREIYHGLMSVEIDGWQLTLFNDCDTLDYCESCTSPEGRVGALETWQRYGTDCDGRQVVGPGKPRSLLVLTLGVCQNTSQSTELLLGEA